MSGIVFGSVSTVPGENHYDPFTPPKEFNGDKKKYVTLCRSRYKDKTWRARIESIVVKYFELNGNMNITGPFKNEAIQIIQTVFDSKCKKIASNH